MSNAISIVLNESQALKKYEDGAFAGFCGTPVTVGSYNYYSSKINDITITSAPEVDEENANMDAP